MVIGFKSALYGGREGFGKLRGEIAPIFEIN